MARLFIHYNPSSGNKDKLVEDIPKALTKNNSTLIPSPVVCKAYTFTSTQNLISTSTLGLPSIYIDVNLQEAIKLILKSFI